MLFVHAYIPGRIPKKIRKNTIPFRSGKKFTNILIFSKNCPVYEEFCEFQIIHAFCV